MFYLTGVCDDNSITRDSASVQGDENVFPVLMWRVMTERLFLLLCNCVQYSHFIETSKAQGGPRGEWI